MRKSYETFLDFEIDMLRDEFLEQLEISLSEEELSELTSTDIELLFQNYLDEYYINNEL